MDRDELLKKISAADFYLIDMNLYLNTHPDDRDALSLYNTILAQSKELRAQYESKYGMLSPATASKAPWQWINNPWPWQFEFNFDLAGDN